MNKNLPIPKNEVSRLDALAQYNILDTLPEEEFDRITQLASIICGVPIALITLGDKDRQWFKSKIGLDTPEIPRDVSFCQYTINGESLFEIEDATKDERFLSNPLVTGQPNIRFYAGFPLIDPEGYALGSLCVIDREARTLTADQRQALTLLANEVVSQIVSRKKNAEKEKLEKMFDLSIDLICVAGTDGYFKKLNPAFTLTLGWTIEELLAKPFYDFIHPDDVTITSNEIKKLATGEKTINFENRFITKNGDYLSMSWVANPDEITGELYAIARDITERKNIEKSLEDSLSSMEAILESTADGILVVDEVGNIVRFNKKIQELWSIPDEVMHTMDDNKALDYVLDKLVNPQNFLAKVQELYANPEAISSDIIELKDGREFDRYSQPRFMDGVHRGRVWSFRNITELTNTEKEKQQLFALIETSQDFIAFADVNGNPTFMNKAARKHLGIDDNKMLSNFKIHDFFDSKEIKFIREDISDGLKKEGKWEGEMHLLNIKTKKAIPVQMSAFVIRDTITGKAIGLGYVSRDITQRKKEERLRKVLQEKYQNIIANMNLGLLEVDNNDIIQYANQSFADISGYEISELLGKTPNEVFIFGENSAVINSKIQLRQQGKSDSYEIQVKNKRGELRWWAVSGAPNYDDEGNLVGSIGIHLDITDRKKADLALKESSQLYFAMFEKNQTPQLLIDPTSGNIIDVNSAATQFYGYSLEEFKLMTISDISTFPSDQLLEEMKKFTITGPSYFQFIHKLASGETCDIEMYTSPMSISGQALLISTINDISKRKLEEERLVQLNNKLKEVNVLKSQFISTVSHEFRTPLAGILSSVQLLHIYNDIWDKDKKEKLFKQIFDAVQHTKALLDDVSLIDEEQTSKTFFRPTNIQLLPLLNEIIEENIRVSETNQKVILKSNLDINNYYMDSIMIRHIFNNIISNSIKYSNKNIIFELNEIDNKEIEFTIKDQGIGIPHEEIKYLLEPFYRASNSGSIKGTGFGLSIVKRFVDLHKGKLLIESVVDKGTTVTITLPYLQT